jgi:hypothetical protein
MWNIEIFRPASGEARTVAVSLREVVCRNELASSRLPDFVTLSSLFGKRCLPFREHRVESFASRIYEVLRKRGERQIIIFENPLYEGSSQYIAEINLENRNETRSLINENLFEGGYVLVTTTQAFRWIGNFTDYGFMFTDESVIKEIFQAAPLTIYNTASAEFRMSEGNDLLLDAEIRKMDRLWSAEQ